MVHQLMEDLMLGGGVFVIVALNVFLLDASLHTSKLRYVHSKNGYYSLLKC